MFNPKQEREESHSRRLYSENYSSSARMKLTRAARPRSTTVNHHSFPTVQLFLLAICRVSEPIALASCFPYAYAMVHDFHVGDRTSASFYTGIFISAFSFAESLTGVFWGGLSDRIGRRPVLLIGCLGTMVSLILVGLAPNFWVALVGRCLGGLLNGNIGIIQTMVGELVKVKEHEPRAYAVMPFVWSVGTIIGPAIGGMLAKPAQSMPSIFSPTGLFANFPYLLPNLICAALLFMSVVFGYVFLIETHPDMQSGRSQPQPGCSSAETPLIMAGEATADVGVDLRADTYGTFNTIEITDEKEWLRHVDESTSRPKESSHGDDQGPKVFTMKILMIITALGIFAYHSMTYDHLLPIFLQDERIEPAGPVTPFSIPGGLGFSTQEVGIIMSIDGVIALFIQGVIFPLFASWLGVWKTFVTVTVMHPIAYFIVPFLALLPSDTVFTGIYICLAIRNFTSILAYPLLLIFLKEAVESPSILGKVNGLAASAGAASRTIAPPLAGYMYGVGTTIGFTGLAWWTSSIVAIVGAFQIMTMQRTKNKSAHVRPMAACLQVATPEQSHGVVHVTTHEQEEVP